MQDEERLKDKVDVKRILRNPNASKEDITKAMSEYFKKHLVPEVTTNLVPVVDDVLSIFDGGL